MKFTLAIPFLAIGALAATPVRKNPTVVRRDLATITSVVATVSEKITALDNAAKAFSGDGTALEGASADVLSAIKDGATTISGTSDISLTDALSLQSIIQDLTTLTETTTDDVIAKKDALVSAGLGATVEQSFVDQKAAAQTLADAITSKVPEAVQEIAAQLSQGIQDALQKGIDAFKGTGGAASSAASSAAASSAVASSAAASSAAASSAAASTPAASSAESSAAPYPVPSTVASSSVAAPTGGSTGASSYVSATPTSTPIPFSGAAAPTAAAGFGAAAVAALVAVAAI